jgi:hypothetical protein
MQPIQAAVPVQASKLTSMKQFCKPMIFVSEIAQGTVQSKL